MGGGVWLIDEAGKPVRRNWASGVGVRLGDPYLRVASRLIKRAAVRAFNEGAVLAEGKRPQSETMAPLLLAVVLGIQPAFMLAVVAGKWGDMRYLPRWEYAAATAGLVLLAAMVLVCLVILPLLMLRSLRRQVRGVRIDRDGLRAVTPAGEHVQRAWPEVRGMSVRGTPVRVTFADGTSWTWGPSRHLSVLRAVRDRLLGPEDIGVIYRRAMWRLLPVTQVLGLLLAATGWLTGSNRPVACVLLYFLMGWGPFVFLRAIVYLSDAGRLSGRAARRRHLRAAPLPVRQ